MRISQKLAFSPPRPSEAKPVAEPKFDRNLLKDGGYVLYLRHASADIGHDDKTSTVPDWWRSRDPNFTRQLDPQGWEQARQIGAGVRSLELKVDHVMCSEFRRTQDTAATLSLGVVEPISDLTPLVYDDSTLPERIESRLNTAPEPGSNTFLVAHGHVTPRFVNLDVGDAAVFVPTAEGSRYLGMIDYEDWLIPSPANAVSSS